MSGLPDELHKSETRLVVTFYLDFLCFHLCSEGLNNIAKSVVKVIMLLYVDFLLLFHSNN